MPGTALRSGWIEWGSDTTDAEFVEELRPTLAEVLRTLPRGDGNVGMHVVRRGARVDWVVASGRPRVTLEPGQMNLQGHEFVEFTGRVPRSVDVVTAVAAWGELEYARCELDDTIELPEFAIRCPVDPSAADAFVELFTRRRGRVLGYRSGQIYVSPSGAMGRTYVRSQPLDVIGDDPEALVAAVNAWRERGGVEPMTLLPAQSETVGQLIPHFVACAEGKYEESVLDDIALGLMAGWDVPHAILESSFLSYMSYSSMDAATAVDEMMRSPIARHDLLDPMMTALAVDLVRFPSGGNSTLFVPYVLLGDPDFDARADEIFDNLTEARRAHGRDTDRLGSGIRAATGRTAAELATTPESEVDLQHFLRRVSNATDSTVSASWFQASDLSTLEWPSDLLDRPQLEAAIGVRDIRRPGEAWARWLVLVVYEI